MTLLMTQKTGGVNAGAYTGIITADPDLAVRSYAGNVRQQQLAFSCFASAS